MIQVIPFLLAGGDRLVGPLRSALQRAFHEQCEVRGASFDPEAAFDPSRGQYHSTALLAALLSDPGAGDDRVLGVTAMDLFIPVLTYVFGEAQVPGRAAVVSSHRLRSELYGLDPDAELLAERLAKEAVHELGHTYGLIHCQDPECVMRASTYVEEIDLKSATFCARCRRALGTGAAQAR